MYTSSVHGDDTYISYPQFAHGFQCVTKHSETTTGNVARGQKDFTNEGGKQDDAAKLDRD